MKTKLMKKSKKGFSLVEVLLAVVLLAIIATPLLQTIIVSIQVNNKSKEQMAANDCCSAVLEYVESMDFESTTGLKKKLDDKTFIVPNGIYDNSDSSIPAISWGAGSSALSYSGFISDIFGDSRLNSDSSRDKRIIIYSSDAKSFVLSNVNYGGYNFDITVQLAENSVTSGGTFTVYDVYVKAYPVRKVNGVSTHGNTPYITDYCGSVFNKFK